MGLDEPGRLGALVVAVGHRDPLVTAAGRRQRGAASHFGGPPADWETFEYAGTAKDALAQLDSVYAAWTNGVRGLGADGLERPCGEAEGPYAEYPLAALVLHINREVLHHGAEIALLRDLYRWKGTDGQARHTL